MTDTATPEMLAEWIDRTLAELEQLAADYAAACIARDKEWRQADKGKGKANPFTGAPRAPGQHRVYGYPLKHIKLAASCYPTLRKAFGMRSSARQSVASHYEEKD